MNLKNESELGDIYISFIYKSINFYRQHLKITYKLCTTVRMEVRSISLFLFLYSKLHTASRLNFVTMIQKTQNDTIKHYT